MKFNKARKKAVLIFSESLLILSAVFWVACQPPSIPMATPTGTPALRAGPQPRADWQAKWEATLAAAKKEGVVVVYGETTPGFREVMAQEFQKKYNIDLEFVSGRSGEIGARWERERSAGVYSVDVFHITAIIPILTKEKKEAYGVLEPYFILPEVTDPKAWRGGEIPFLDKDKTVIALTSPFLTLVAINTDLVKEGQIKTYKDLLKPEWKGKIVLMDPTFPSAGAGWATLLMTDIFGQEGGKEYLRQFAALEPAITRDVRQQIEWVAQGKYPIGVGVQQRMVSEFKSMGARIDIPRMTEGSLNAGSGCLEVSTKPPHPNAATIYINWLLTKEGQATFSKGWYSPPSRIDVTVEGIDPAQIARPGDKAFFAGEDFFKTQGQVQEIAKEIFARR